MSRGTFAAGTGSAGREARERIEAYLDELRTTQRYRFYRALQHPLYPILRKVRRVAESASSTRRATGRVVYVSNHKSHLDYLVEPLVLDDNGVRPPLTAAGINLFGGPLGLLHRHVTGAIPIRRNTKDPAYLVTLKAYVAELLQRHDLLFYIEGGRSYSGELKSPKTGLLQAALQAERRDCVIVPIAVAYDLVLEDHILPHQAVKRRSAPFRARSRRDGAVRGRLPVASVRHVRHADSARRLRSRVAPRRDDPRAPDPRRDRAALQGAADRGRRRRDASVDDEAGARGFAPTPSSTCCGKAERTSACRAAARPSTRRAGARGSQHHLS